jgi:hypothetical protein
MRRNGGSQRHVVSDLGDVIRVRAGANPEFMATQWISGSARSLSSDGT